MVGLFAHAYGLYMLLTNWRCRLPDRGQNFEQRVKSYFEEIPFLVIYFLAVIKKPTPLFRSLSHHLRRNAVKTQKQK